MNRAQVTTVLVTGVVTFALAMITLRHGVMFGPDAWTYWSASVALLEGRGYVDAHGLPVVDWPPGYSLWLALVQSVAGVSVAAVRLADSLLIGASSAAFCAWAMLRTARADRNRWLVAMAACTGCLAMARGAGSEMPMLAGLSLALVCVERWRHTEGWRRFAWLTPIALLCGWMVLTRYAALAFVPAFFWLMQKRRLDFALVVAVTIATWLISRAVLEQGGALRWFEMGHSLGTLLYAMVAGIDRGIAPFPIGFALFVLVWLAVGPLRVRAQRWLQLPADALQHAPVGRFVNTAVLALLAMFVIVYVADRPSARFMRFASVITVVLAVAIVSSSPVTWLRRTLLVLLLVPNAIQAGKHAVRGRRGETTLHEHGGGTFLPLNAVPGAAGTEQRERGGKLIVPVPLFSWQRARLERGEGR